MSTIVASRPVKTPALLKHLPAAPLVDAVHRAGVVLIVQPEDVQRAFFRAQVRGSLTAAAADQLACSLLHEHPVMIWGDLWWEVGA